jgi:formylglycine-generating enzyme required for sulfatase activity
MNQSGANLVAVGAAAWGLTLVCGAASAADAPSARAAATRMNQLITACVACHSTDNLRLDPAYPVPKIGMQHADYMVQTLRAYKSGERNNELMRAQVATLSVKDLQELARYFSADPARAAPPLPVPPETHPAKSEELCGACHGETGLGNMPGYPVLSGQYEDYLLHALNDYRSGRRKHAFMPEFARTLTAAEMQELAHFYSTKNRLELAISPGNRAIKSIVMIDIPGGEFQMGTDTGRDFNIGRPAHLVHIRPFRLGRYSVTFDQFDAFATAANRNKPQDEGWGRGSRPVINVDWQDTQDFIAWLNSQTGRHFRLPTEAEREYATRAGSSTNFWWGDTLDQDFVNAQGIKGRDQWNFTAPVGQFPANAFGLHDMSGNVWERTADCWHSNYGNAPADGSAWLKRPCNEHVIRGGYWDLPRSGHYTRYRALAADAFGSSGLSFRLAEDP